MRSFMNAWRPFDVGALVEGPERCRVSGSVLACKRTPTKSKQGFVREYTFSFIYEGVERRLVCYGDGPKHGPGDAVVIEFPPRNPDRGRIVGMRCATFPGWTILPYLIAPGLGLAMAGKGVVRGFRTYLLVEGGHLASVQFSRLRITHKEIQGFPLDEAYFYFVDHQGMIHEVCRKYPFAFTAPEPGELLFYDPDCPQRAELLSAIPGQFWWDGMSLRLDFPTGGWRLLLLPCLVLVQVGLLAYLYLPR